METVEYECENCHFWEVTHGIGDYKDEKYKKCLNCRKRLIDYRNWVEKQGDK